MIRFAAEGILIRGGYRVKQSKFFFYRKGLLLGFFYVGLFSLQVTATSKEYHQKTVLLTGAAGFIGSNFLKYMFDRYSSYQFLVLDCLTYAGNLDNIPDYIKCSPRFKFFY